MVARTLRGIFGPRRGGVAGDRRQETGDSCITGSSDVSSPYITRIIG
jgi:hypothetical protein